MTGSVCPSRISTLVIFAACVALLGPAIAAENLDADQALEQVYGELEFQGDVALWKLTDDKWKTEKSALGWDAVQISVLTAPTFLQDGTERAFLVVQLLPESNDDYKCHSCAPSIGAATFTRTAEGWRLDASSPVVTKIGSFGAAPKPELIRVGPERHALVFSWSFTGQGHTQSGNTYLAETGEGVSEALVLETHYDNAGACGPEEEGLRPCEEWTSTLEFVPGENPDYFDLKVTDAEPAVYSYSDGTYRKAAPPNHCRASEPPIFFCEIDQKNLSVCLLDGGQVSYRFGPTGKPEITIDSAAKLSSRGYPGGGEGRLRFTNDAYDYLVYDLIRYSGEFDEETGTRSFEDRAGVYVLKDGELVADLVCTDWDGADGGKVMIHKLTAKQEEEFLDLE